MDYITEVRETLQDIPELNHILLERDDGKEYTDREIERYIIRALSRINMKPPVTNYSIDNFPQSHWLLVVDGAIIEALQSKGILKLRNEMNYQDQGGTTVRLEGKGQKYFQFASSMYQRWMQALADFKEGISVESAWGGVNSEYQRNFW